MYLAPGNENVAIPDLSHAHKNQYTVFKHFHIFRTEHMTGVLTSAVLSNVIFVKG
jgi:hypothetical protein